MERIGLLGAMDVGVINDLAAVDLAVAGCAPARPLMFIDSERTSALTPD